MEKIENHFEQLKEIRAIMQQSVRFLSLSGLSGISAGLTAIAGTAIAFFYLDYDARYFSPDEYFGQRLWEMRDNFLLFMILDALLVLVIGLGLGIFFSVRYAKKQNMPFWNQAAKRMLANLAIPLAIGGAFCVLLAMYGLIFLLAPASLVFYGLALLNASKYTLHEIKYLGVSQAILGIIAGILPGYGIFFWAIGFGLLHIIYGSYMHRKYERNHRTTK